MLDFKAIIDLMHRAGKSAAPIRHLVEAGTPVLEAVQQQAPEIHAAIKELAAANATPVTEVTTPHGGAGGTSQVPASSHHAEAAIAKAIFVPEHLDPNEKAWMDRASSGTSGG